MLLSPTQGRCKRTESLFFFPHLPDRQSLKPVALVPATIGASLCHQSTLLLPANSLFPTTMPETEDVSESKAPEVAASNTLVVETQDADQLRLQQM